MEFARIQTYKTLKYHISVTKYPRVKGVIKYVVFIDHAISEYGENDNNTDDGHTKKNKIRTNQIHVLKWLVFPPPRISTISDFFPRTLCRATYEYCNKMEDVYRGKNYLRK